MHGSGNLALHVAESSSFSWIVDSSASNHMTGDKSIFATYSPCNGHQTVRIANGTRTEVTGTRTINLSNTIILYSVLFVPDLNCNLISINKPNKDLNCETKFFAKHFVF